jgi:hypothetical protein
MYTLSQLNSDCAQELALHNAQVSPARQVSPETVGEIINREAPNFVAANRAVVTFLNTTENPQTNTSTIHVDLLHPGHPLATSPVPEDSSLRAQMAEFVASDNSIPENLQSIVASAIAAEPDSRERRYYFAQLEALTTNIHVYEALSTVDDYFLDPAVEPLVAWGKESLASRKARVAKQLRDRFGRWIEMGGGVSFGLRLKDGKSIIAHGTFGGTTGDNSGQVKVSGEANLKDGYYKVEARNISKILGTVSAEYLKGKGLKITFGKGGRSDADIPDLAKVEYSPEPFKNTDGKAPTSQEIAAASLALGAKSKSKGNPAGGSKSSGGSKTVVDKILESANKIEAQAVKRGKTPTAENPVEVPNWAIVPLSDQKLADEIKGAVRLAADKLVDGKNYSDEQFNNLLGNLLNIRGKQFENEIRKYYDTVDIYEYNGMTVEISKSFRNKTEDIPKMLELVKNLHDDVPVPFGTKIQVLDADSVGGLAGYATSVKAPGNSSTRIVIVGGSFFDEEYRDRIKEEQAAYGWTHTAGQEAMDSMGAPYLHTISHEWGHALDYAFGVREMYDDLFNMYGQTKQPLGFISAAYRKYVNNLGIKVGEEPWLGTYGKTAVFEGLAESFAEWYNSKRYDIPNTRIPKELSDFFDEAMEIAAEMKKKRERERE